MVLYGMTLLAAYEVSGPFLTFEPMEEVVLYHPGPAGAASTVSGKMDRRLRSIIKVVTKAVAFTRIDFFLGFVK